jgi:hypothetical protein
MNTPKLRAGVLRSTAQSTVLTGLTPSWPAPAIVDCDHTCPHTTVRYPCGATCCPPRTRYCEKTVVEPVCRQTCIANNAIIEQATNIARAEVVAAFHVFAAAHGGSCKKTDAPACSGVLVGTASAVIIAKATGSGGAVAPWAGYALSAVAAAATWYCNANCQG